MLVDQLKNIVGEGGWTADSADLLPHLTEWRDTWTGETLLLVFPDSTDKVSKILKACHETGTAVVPQGGNTGLCGGAIPDKSGNQVLLSLAKLNRIRDLNQSDYSITVEAGCTLATVQDAAEKADRFFPLSLAAEGSCQIGGNLSTNAGGINVLRYGTARAQALGLEVVLADGTIWDGLRSLRKDTAGYDLKQVFIGAEGTLGIITAACLRLYPPVRNAQTAFLAIQSPHDAVTIHAKLREEMSDQLQAFELIPQRALRFVEQHIPASKMPLALEAEWFILLEAGNVSDFAAFESTLEALMNEGAIEDAVIAKNRSEAQNLWRTRHSISEAQKREGASLKHDVSVPVARVGEFIEAAEAAVSNSMPGIRPVPFGHVGDGNIHFNLSQPKDMDGEKFLDARESQAKVVNDIVAEFDGSISAEHGVGQAKREQLTAYRSTTEIELMRSLKRALDPANILNPGKVI